MRAAIATGMLVVAVAVGLLTAAQRHPLVTDSLGYVTAGRRLADGDGLSWRDDVNRIAGPFSSPMAYPVRRGDAEELRFGYAPGFPAAIAVVVQITGRAGAATLVGPIFGALAVAATAALAWAVLRSAWAALAAGGLFALVPDLWRFGTDSWADVPAAALAAGGVAAAIAALRAGAGRTAVALAATSGALLAALAWVRPAGLATVAAVGIAAAWSARTTPSARLVPVAIAFAGVLAVGIGALLAFQASWFGGPLSSGYSVEHGWYPHEAFRLGYAFGPSFVNGRSVPEAAATLWRDAGPLLAVAALGAAVVGRPARALLLAGFVGSITPYLVYAFAPTDENARFLLPALPFVVVAAVAAVRTAGRVRVVASAVAVLSAVLLVPRALDARAEAVDAAAAAEDRVGAAVALADRLPPDAVVVSHEWNDALAVHGGRSVLNVRRMAPGDPAQGRYRTDLLPTCLTGAVDALLEAGRPVAVVEGAAPSALDPFPVLRAAFVLEADGDDPTIWHVTGRRSDAPPGSVEPCRRAVVDG